MPNQTPNQNPRTRDRYQEAVKMCKQTYERMPVTQLPSIAYNLDCQLGQVAPRFRAIPLQASLNRIYLEWNSIGDYLRLISPSPREFVVRGPNIRILNDGLTALPPVRVHPRLKMEHHGALDRNRTGEIVAIYLNPEDALACPFRGTLQELEESIAGKGLNIVARIEPIK
jgi:hypothetical protein